MSARTYTQYKPEEVEQLVTGVSQNVPLSELAGAMGRTEYSLVQKLRKLPGDYIDHDIAEKYIANWREQWHPALAERQRDWYINKEGKGKKKAYRDIINRDRIRERENELYHERAAKKLLPLAQKIPYVGYNIGSVEFVNGTLKIRIDEPEADLPCLVEDFRAALGEVPRLRAIRGIRHKNTLTLWPTPRKRKNTFAADFLKAYKTVLEKNAGGSTV